MRQRIFGLGVAVFFVLGMLIPSLVWSNGGDLITSNPTVQVKIESIQLSSDGGATWGDNILSSASSYITFEPTSSTSIFDYFAQNLQVSAGVYNKVKVVLNSVVKGYCGIQEGGETSYYPLDYSFDQYNSSTGQGGLDLSVDMDSKLTTTPNQGWWSITLVSGYETITADFLDANGSATTLTIADGQTSTIRVAIYNVFILTNPTGSIYSIDANPSDSTRIYVE